MLKTLGATRAQILWSFTIRSALLGSFAGLIALAAGVAGGWSVSTYIFETDFHIVWPSALGVIGGGILATLLSGLAFALRPLAARPARVLRASG